MSDQDEAVARGTAAAPDGDVRPPDDPAAGIGARVTEYRLQHGKGVSALAREVGVSPSLISQIERGQSRPSVSTLFGLATALDVPVDAFFRPAGAPPASADRPNGRSAARADAPPADAARPGGPPDEPRVRRGRGRRAAGAANGSANRYVVRLEDRLGIDIEGGVRWERLTPTQLDAVEFMELVYVPGAESHSSLYHHPGVEMLVVLVGRLTIFVGFEEYELEAGDSICFPSTVPHRYCNTGEETARAITVIMRDAADVSWADSAAE